MILIDGVRYKLAKPEKEEILEDSVREHSKEIWGENSVYFDKKRLKTASGIVSIPDGYVVVFETIPHWYIVEVELATHPLHNHLTPQISKFSSGISSKANRDEIIDRMYQTIENDEELQAMIKKKIAPSEIYKFLAGAIKERPTLAIIIDEKTAELEEVIENFSPNFKNAQAMEFKTFLREGCDSKVHAHIFEPLYNTMNLVPAVQGSKTQDGRIDGDKHWNEQRFFTEMGSKQSADEVSVANAILDWAKKQPLRVYWGTGKITGSFVPELVYHGEKYYPIVVSTNGRLTIQFGALKSRSAFKDDSKRLELLQRLNKIPGISLPSDSIDRYPHILIKTINKSTVLDQFLAIFDWISNETRITPKT